MSVAQKTELKVNKQTDDKCQYTFLVPTPMNYEVVNDGNRMRAQDELKNDSASFDSGIETSSAGDDHFYESVKPTHHSESLSVDLTHNEDYLCPSDSSLLKTRLKIPFSPKARDEFCLTFENFFRQTKTHFTSQDIFTK